MVKLLYLYVLWLVCYLVIFIWLYTWIDKEFTLGDFINYMLYGKRIRSRKWKILAVTYISLFILGLVIPISIALILLLQIFF